MEEREKDNLGNSDIDLSSVSEELIKDAEDVITIDDENVIDEPEVEEIVDEPDIINIEDTRDISSLNLDSDNVTEKEPEVVSIEEEPQVESVPEIEEIKDEESPAEEVPKEEVKEDESFMKDIPKKKVEATPEETKVPKAKKYVSFEDRMIRYSLLFAVLFVLGFFLIYKSININGEEYINYTETSNLDYKVFLKKNDFYEEQFLGKGMLYVASLIDHIDIDFLYNFNISEPIDLDFKYDITGVLSIMSSDGKKTYLTKSYDLLDNKSFSLRGSQDRTIRESIQIDYDNYNKLANSFKSTYGLDTSSKLAIYLNINKTALNDEDIKDSNNKEHMLIEIPLSERSVSISMDYKDINTTSKLVKNTSVTVKNIVAVIVAVILLLISFYGLYNVIRLLGLLGFKKSRYDKYISKLLRQYDRLIVVHYTCPDLQNYNVIKIKEFNELLDTRDNLKSPIMYYNVTDHQKSYFYIINNSDLYLLVLKAVDFEK